MRRVAEEKLRAVEAAQELAASRSPAVRAKAADIARFLENLPDGAVDILSADDGELRVSSVSFELQRVAALQKEFALRRALRVNVKRDEECYVAYSGRFSVHGTGDTVGDALSNYMEEFIRYSDWLEENEANLAPLLRKELKGIRNLLVEAS